MLTQCPHCQTIFRITQDILGVADGQVRCGRCGASFDGISGFVDRHQLLTARRTGGAALGKSAPASPKPAAPLPMPISEPAKSDAAELATKGPERSKPEQPKKEPQSKASEPSTRQPVATNAPTPPTPPVPPALAPSPPAATTPSADPAAETSTATADDVDRLLQRPRKPTSGAWKYVVPPLLMLLCIQLVHYFRQDIASNPRFGPPLIALYTNLGLYLTPHWRLRDYEVRQWGVLANPQTPGTLKVRASITNRAPFAQPYPLLRLVLEDRFGQQVQAREFEPAEYAVEKFGANARLLPNERIDASLTIVDPGSQAEGFRFDVCLRQPKGVFCADDEPAL